MWEEDPERMREYHEEQRRLADTFFKVRRLREHCAVFAANADTFPGSERRGKESSPLEASSLTPF